MPGRGRLPAALLAAAVVAGVAVSEILRAADRRGEDAQLRRLAAAVGPHRVTRARLTGAFAYAPCDTAMPNDTLVVGLLCGDERAARWASQSRELASVATAMRASGEGAAASASGQHLAALWHIVWDDAAAAVGELQRAAALAPTNARIQSDLAAALLARAQRAQDPRHILEALKAADSAVVLDPRLPEARFNRALVLEQFSIRAHAIEEWDAYLKLDPSSLWSAEARVRLTTLRKTPSSWDDAERRLQTALAANDSALIREITREYPVRVRDWGSAAAIAWAHAHQTSDPRSDALLRRAETLARAVESVTGEALPVDVVGSVERATANGDRWRLDQIARGLVAYERGHRFLAAFEFDSAAVWIAEASRALGAGRSAAAYWAAYDSADISYQTAGPRGYDRALSSFARILATAPPNYRAIRGRAVRSQGLVHFIRADYDAAIRAYQLAIVEGQGTGDPALEVRPHGMLASLYAELRGDGEAWRELFSAFRSLGQSSDAPGEAQRLFVMATQLSWRQYPSAAALFQEEAVRLARVVDSGGTMTVSALAQQAELLGRAGLTDQAMIALRAARAAADSIAGDSVRATKIADVDLAEGAVLLRMRPESAAVILRRVVDRYRDSQYLLELARANLLLANAYASTGNMDSARGSFDRALSETERQRAAILASDDRMRFLDRARPVVDRIVGFLADRADTLGSLTFFEQMRARVLLERVEPQRPSDDARSVGIDGLRRELSPAMAVVSYAVLDSELVTWTISRDKVRMRRTALSAPLGPVVERFTKLITSRASESDLRPVASELYNVLIAPVANDLAGKNRLVLIPDKAIHFVPFAALFDSVTRRFLVESFELDAAPSLELYRQSAARYTAFGKSTPRVLAVGNPTFDRATFALPALPGAEREAVSVAEDYAGARLLVGAAATKRAFLREAADADIVHFAGHGVVKADAPLRSYLLLANDPNDGSSGALYARELFDATLAHTRLAILSGCHTASGQLSETEGASSLARALFASGVPAVIASLWAVDDDRTATFFSAYHRELSRGIDPVTALRQTQRHWISQPNEAWRSLSTWAAFQLFGATSASIVANTNR